MKKHLLALAAGLMLLAGCVTMGREFPVGQVGNIANGKTSQAEILESFGQPYQKGIEDGKVSWTYYLIKYRGMKKADSKQLHLVFDGKGLVESYSFTETVPLQD